MPTVRPLTERDLPQAWRIVRTAFGTFFAAPDPETFWSDRDLHTNRFRSEHVEAFVAEEEGAVVGSNFATRWGSVGFFGPLSTSVDRWNAGLAQPLVAAVCETFDRWGVTQAGLFTFAQSTKHIHLYSKFGFHPRFLTVLMTAPARPGTLSDYSRYSALALDGRQAAEDATFALSDSVYEGLDLRGEIRAIAAQGLGDTLLLWDGPSRLAGFAICHWGPASEAGEGCLYIKFGAARPGPGAGDRFAALLDAASVLAQQAGMPAVLAGINLSHEDAWRQMKAHGYRPVFQGVAMHRGNEPGYCRPDTYVIDDWR
jgi:predicted N-acetyltransferase YhbS